MEVQHDQEPFARPRYRCIVTEARHEEQRGEIKSTTHPRPGTRMLCTGHPAAKRTRQVNGCSVFAGHRVSSAEEGWKDRLINAPVASFIMLFPGCHQVGKAWSSIMRTLY